MRSSVNNDFYLLHYPFTLSLGLNLDMTNKPPLAFFNLYFTSAVKHLIYVKSVRCAEQVIASMESYLHDHPNTCGHDWRRNSMKHEEVHPLLAIIITMGVVGYPSMRSLL